MELETANGIHKKNVTEQVIIDVFADDSKIGEFIILSQEPQIYMQAAGEGDGPYLVEYREGNSENHFKCSKGIEKKIVEELFKKYLQNDFSWKNEFEWVPLNLKQSGDSKPWWKFW